MCLGWKVEATPQLYGDKRRETRPRGEKTILLQAKWCSGGEDTGEVGVAAEGRIILASGLWSGLVWSGLWSLGMRFVNMTAMPSNQMARV